MNKKFEIFMVTCLFAASFLLARKGAALAADKKDDKESISIVIDAGHGSGNLRKVAKG